MLFMTEVLVVGSGLGGSAAAMFLARRGVQVQLVEKHQSTSPHPRASGQYPRTMEFLRIGGVADEIRAVGGEMDGFKIKVAESVRGRVLHTIVEDFSEMLAAIEHISPAGWGSASQDQVEPILLAQAEKHGATIRFGTELVSFEQDEAGVTATLLDLATGRTEEVRTQYLVAADGNRSTIRERLGITRHGKGMLANHIGIVFEADLADLLPESETWLYYLQNPAFTGAFINTNHKNRFIFSVEYHPENGESALDYPPARIAELIRIGLDTPDLEPEIVWQGTWEMAARIAEKWRAGRIFLVGDAGKVTPPTGGMGGNAAVCDGYDIAWKLAAVLQGQAGPGLLDTYEAERRDFAQLVVNESLHNYVQRMAPHLAGDDIPESLGPPQVMLGNRARSTAIIHEDGDDDAPVENPFEPTARPGFRAPHAWLAPGRSTLGLFGAGWVLLTGPDGAGWHEAAKQARIPLDVHDLGEHTALYGISSEGASLVRPDGVVAWRTSVSADAETLNGVLSRVLSC
jgi:2-polyprenyl-6-methoxyphenol hydroxylase-like FAD-dependent oxidoreductase